MTLFFKGITAGLLVLAAGSTVAAELNIGYETKTQGRVSLGIFDKDGRLIRTLQNGKKQEPGEYTIVWDGKNQDGKEVSSGDYKLKGIVSNIKTDYAFVAGNPNKIPYKTADGKGAWNGFWGNPLGLTSDDSGIYILYHMEEGDGSLLKVDSSGNILWKAHMYQKDGSGFQLAIATDGKHVYIASDVGVSGDMRDRNRKIVIWRVKAETGEFDLWEGHGLMPGKPFQTGPIPFWEIINGDKQTPPAVDGIGDGANCRGIAVRNGLLYISLYRENAIEVWNTEKGEKAGMINNIPKPQGITIDKNGSLYVASEKDILKITTGSDGKSATKISKIIKDIAAPYGVAVDKNGNIYVTDLGTSQQVKKFSNSGELIWTAGKIGGRPFHGKMEHNSFLFPAGITTDEMGNVYVGEDYAPVRVTILNQEGKITKEWIGSMGVGAGLGIAVDEEDPSLVYAFYTSFTYCGVMHMPLVRYRIDYNKKTWEVDGYWMGIVGHGGGPEAYDMNISNPRNIVWGNADTYIRHFKGHTYLFNGQNFNHPILRVQGYDIIPSACVGQTDRWLPVDLDKGYTLDANGNPAIRNSSRPFIWRDKDGDGLASSDEVEFFDEPKGMVGHGCWGGYIDYEMNVYLPDDTGTGNVYKIPCLGIDEKGNPIYSWANSEIVIKTEDAVLTRVDYARVEEPNRAGQMRPFYIQRIHLDKEKNIYGIVEVPGQDKGIGWASSRIDVKAGKWNSFGRLLWKTGEKAKGFSKPGEFYAGSGVDGVIKGFVFFTDENGQSRIYSKEGLYAGSVPASDPYRGIAFGSEALTVELCGARVFTEPKSGIDYYMAGDETGLHFWRLKGLDEAEYIGIPVKLE